MTQVALITGASRGLGAELAGFLAKQGYDLVLTARGAEALQATVRSLEKYGGRIIAVPGDVSQAAHRSRLVGAAESLGRLDLLVNNASDLGQSPLPSLEDYPLDTFQQVLQVNLIAPLGLVQIALPLLRSSGGMVINLSSDAAVGGYQGWGAYGVSKAALDLVSLTLSEELREVSPETHAARAAGGRVIAVGTTVVRALESAWDGTAVQPVSGFTRLYIHHNHGLHIVDGLLTGFHDPMASHLAMLYALAGEEMIRGAYREAVESGYLWHEFGDTNLILPDRQYPNQDAPGD